MINYVINLDRRADRWEEFIQRIQDSQQLSSEKFIRISGFDGYNHEEELTKYGLQNSIFVKFFKKHKSNCKKGEFGVYMSHYITLYNIHLNKDIGDDDYVGVYEDDFMLGDDFELGVDFLYLGGRFAKNFSVDSEEMFEKTSCENIVRRKKVGEGGYQWDRTIHAYVVRKGSCRKILELISTNFPDNALRLRPIDTVIASLYNDIRMCDIVPHLYYSEPDYKSDIQKNEDLIYF